jgi:hypothetical protein
MTAISGLFGSFTPRTNEARTVEDLVRRLLRLLGHDYEAHARLATPDGTKRPRLRLLQGATRRREVHFAQFQSVAPMPFWATRPIWTGAFSENSNHAHTKILWGWEILLGG